MDGIGFVFIDSLGVLVSIALLLVVIAFAGWFGFAVGSAISDEHGGFPGVLIGVAFALYLMFFT